MQTKKRNTDTTPKSKVFYTPPTKNTFGFKKAVDQITKPKRGRPKKNSNVS